MPFRRAVSSPSVSFAAVAALGVLAFGANRANPAGASAAGVPVPVRASGDFIQLARGAHPLARPENDLGRLDPSKRLENLSLVMRLSPEQTRDRDALVAAVTDPTSASYHHWLTPAEYAARFGATPDDLSRARAWLVSQGFEVGETSPLGARIHFAGTVAGVESAFRAEMHRYTVDGEPHYAPASAPSVPDDLADVVLGVMNLHDFYPHPMVRPEDIHPQANCPTTDLLCAGIGFAPPDWSTVYDAPSGYDGTGVTIMVVGVADVAQSDLDAFRSTYNASAPAGDAIVKTLVPGTGAAAPGQKGPGAEAVLDLEWTSNMAPKATVNYVYTGANDPNVFDAIYYAIEQNFGGVLSVSWGGCEEGSSPSDADTTEVFGSAADLLGISFLAAAGDSGAAGCQGKGGLYVDIPASFPGVTAVGGTEFPISGGLFNSSGVAGGYSTTEAVWNESDDPAASTGVASGGGGVSVVFSRPDYQTQAAAPSCLAVGSLPVSGITGSAMRQVPDVSFSAAGGTVGYGYYLECSFDFSSFDCGATATTPVVLEIGGTSAATPSFAGIVARANQAAGGRLGNINPLLYQLPSATFHDIATGNNEIKCAPSDPGCPDGGVYGYPATSGYDCATGLGSVDTTKFVAAVAALAPTTTTLASVTSPLTEGMTVPLTATVASATGEPTGTVTFTFQSYLANGAPDLSWSLGTASVTGGTASPSAPFAIPPGLVAASAGVDLYATYGGDATHLPSVSPKVHVSFSPSTLCVAPAVTSVAPGGKISFATMGGTPPVRYTIADFGYDDGTAVMDDAGANGSTLDETTGLLTAGTGQPGYVVVQVVDSAGAETFAEVTVGAPTGSPPWSGDAGIVATACSEGSDGGVTDAGASDGGNDAGVDSGAPEDAGAPTTGGSRSSSGCSCHAVGNGSPNDGVGLVTAAFLGLAFVGRRRRRDRRRVGWR